MRPCSAALAAFLQGANYEVVQVDLYTFALVTGETFRYTSGDAPLIVPAEGFPATSSNAGADRSFALGPRFGRSKIITRLGVEPTELEIDVLAGPGDLVGTAAFAEAVRIGLFDGATVELDRFFAHRDCRGCRSMLVSGASFGFTVESRSARSAAAVSQSE
jgi:hypothetical protein